MPEKTHRAHKYLFLFVLLSAAALLLSGCKAEELPFETIEKGELISADRVYEGINSKLVVLTSASEARLLERGISRQAQADLEALDYERSFAIAVFQGYKGSSGHGVQIESLMLEDITITVKALFNDPEKGQVEIITDGDYSPYHLVKVPKEGLHGALEFVLEVDSEVLLRETRSFP
jgi:hypothetical protein